MCAIHHTPAHLLGKPEKRELEALILERLVEHYDGQGSGALLGEGLRIVVNGDGVRIDNGETADALAIVKVRDLFTALCYVTAGAPGLPRDALEPLATEATSALATQINKLLGT
jgi:hypothetical protein